MFVRDGFHFWAMVLGPLWLIWHRLWLALLGWIVADRRARSRLIALGAGGMAVLLANALIALLMGFEAATLQRWTCRGANGASSTSSWPMTRKPPSGASSIA